MNKSEVEELLTNIASHIKKEEYKGWDPYDALNSAFLRKASLGIKILQRIIIQLFKFLPINFRPLLRIDKELNATALCFCLDAYQNIYEVSKDEKSRQEITYLYNKIIEIALIDSEEELGWGRNFKYITNTESHEITKPLTYLNAKIGHSIYLIKEHLGEDKARVDLKRICTSIIKNGRVFEYEKGTFIGYSSDENPRFIFNTVIYSARVFVEYLDIADVNETTILGYDLKKLTKNLIQTILDHQKDDGSWNYGFDFEFNELTNIDFHQGYVTDALKDIMQVEGADERYQSAYDKGIDFMAKYQISDEGIFKWRFPKKYPVDIHNQAQAIISLCKEKKYDVKLQNAITFTLKHFWNNKKNYFFYQKTPFLINKIAYMRWSQAVMFYAFSTFFNNRFK